jgi:DNA replication and repair protein RecF
MPLIGPHRDDLEVLWGGHPVRATVSAGERKALSLLLTAAHGRVLTAAGRHPVYLLDDVDAELSEESLGRVWQAFSDVSQLVATSNRPGVWEKLAAGRRWRVAAGAVKP